MRTVRVIHHAGTSMWSILKWLAMRLAIVRWLFKILGLGVFLPLALLLKVVGLPVLIVLAVLSLPIFLLLFLFGLPLFLVFAAGAAVLGILFAALSLGLLALKFAIFVVLPIWLVWRLASWLFRRRDASVREAPRPDTTGGADAA